MSGKYQAEDGTKVIGPDMLENHYGWYFITKKAFNDEREREKNEKIAKEKRTTAEAERVKKLFELAKATGEKQKITSFPVDCEDLHEECNTDIVTVWALPNGDKKTTQVHTW